MIYGQMFVTNYPDWFNRPSVFKGTVESVQKKEKIPLITIRNGEEEIQLTVDDGIEQSIHQDDLIEVSYLPTKKKVFDCTLLTRQAESHI
ncbi:MAG: hypothetical protein AWM53_00533 [Candidatus Dichloromethanomonas elyunquensis]|nr:MAG: hypothetical protein AWM53_00533 [Candidatus Dichloromethanomonas elyunquensis]